MRMRWAMSSTPEIKRGRGGSTPTMNWRSFAIWKFSLQVIPLYKVNVSHVPYQPKAYEAYYEPPIHLRRSSKLLGHGESCFLWWRAHRPGPKRQRSGRSDLPRRP